MSETLPSRRARMRITVLLSTAIGTLVLLSVGAVLFVTAVASYKNTWELMLQSGTLLTSNLEERVRQYVDPAKRLSDHIAFLTQKGTFDPSDLEAAKPALLVALGPAPQIAGSAVWNSAFQRTDIGIDGNGEFIFQTTDDAAIPAMQPFLQRLKSASGTYWAPPIFVAGATHIDALTPLRRDGNFVGAFATGIEITDLSRFVSTMGKELGMTAFILYGDEHVLAHPKLSTRPKRSDLDPKVDMMSIAGLGDPVLSALSSADSTPAEFDPAFEVAEFSADGQSFVLLTKKITDYGDVPWRLGVYAPRDQLDDQLERLYGSIAIGAALWIGSLLIGWLVARKVAQPIVRVADAATQISDLDFDAVKPLGRSRIRELDDQSSAFDKMVEGLRYFETYVPRSLVRQLMSQGGGTEIQSAEVELTLMFTDIVGFTRRSENMSPKAVAEMLNQHFDVVNRCIEAEGGTIDKYIGDAVMAFWGAPQPLDDHAERACRAALAMRCELAAQNAADVGHPDIRMKIAIHTGPLIVGNIGARGRINYTIVGDTVNTCSRIEKLCGDIDDGSETAVIVISEATRDMLGPGFETKKAGTFDVKGKSERLDVFELSQK